MYSGEERNRLKQLTEQWQAYTIVHYHFRKKLQTKNSIPTTQHILSTHKTMLDTNKKKNKK
jgi:hypothetical protein